MKMKKKNVETLAAGIASMNLGTTPTADILNEPAGAALIALNQKKDLTNAESEDAEEDPRKK